MKFAVITHVLHEQDKTELLAYAPYVNEMNLWFKHVDSVRVVAPLSETLSRDNKLLSAYRHNCLQLKKIPPFSLINFKESLKALWALPQIVVQIFRACMWADHLHLRCPGNMGLLSCGVQILFPHKPKTAKYAGNWDPKSKQPLSYRLQKWILNNPFLTRNMQVMVYGEWPDASKNMVPFFTATYSENEKTPLPKRDYYQNIRFVFAGSLSANKHPFETLLWIHQMKSRLGLEVSLDFYGDGPEKVKLLDYIEKNKLENRVKLHGNQPKEILKKAYQHADFLVLPSRSEGWPKVVAEAMFWGTIPVASSVSCLPWMLDFGKRGLLFEEDLESLTPAFTSLLQNSQSLEKMANLASLWSRKYTLERFETEIQKLLNVKPS